MKKSLIILISSWSFLFSCTVTDIVMQREGKFLSVHGTADCSKGIITVKLYDKDTDTYIDNMKAVINDGVFKNYFLNNIPANPYIKYGARAW